ncbi:MAG: ribonuclease HII [Atopostipes suicloacalis]|nr:ribonuclease HII [Atopostipes suicloacalis]
MPKKLTVKEVKEKLKVIKDSNSDFFQSCLNDDRKGVQKAVQQWQRKQLAKKELTDRFERMNQYEQEAKEAGYLLVAGIDEVGRGPLAGPVVSAAVILDEMHPIIGLDDSKKLSLKKRELLFEEVQEKAIGIGIGLVDSQGIDQHNILGATKIAMQKAVNHLNKKVDYLLIDAVDLKNNLPAKVMNQGDTKSNSIAAASIIAKVTRDKMMQDYAKIYPGYGFENNAGYGTKEHLNGLKDLGPCPIHRYSFAPVRKHSK